MSSIPRRVLILTLLSINSVYATPIAQPTIDGNLSDMKAIVLQVQSEGLQAVAINQLDNIDNGPMAGLDGFQDEPLQDNANPHLEFMRSGINVGNSILIYVPDSDGIVEPASADDSWLAVGVNIANGDGDIFANPLGQTGPPYIPCNIMVPFDADGNGHPCTLGTGQSSRWCIPANPGPNACSPFAPAANCPQPVQTFDESQEALTLLFHLCASSPGELLGQPDFDIVYSQRFSQNTSILVEGVSLSTVQVFPPAGNSCTQIRDRGTDGLTFADGLGNDDFEFLINKIDSQIHAHYPGEDYYYVTRYRLANLGLAIRSDATADLSNEDSMFIVASLDLFGGDCNSNGTDDVCEGFFCTPGSCCRANGSCAVTELADCADGYWTIGGECDPNVCPSVGACCHDDGSCNFGIESNCVAGEWNVAQPCIPNTCPQPGECCRSDGSCTASLATACIDGAWTEGGTCSGNPCPQPGRCCPGDGTCTFQLQATCTGTWQEGGSCTSNPCPATPTLAAAGCRYLSVNPNMPGTDEPFALRVTSAELPCIDLFVSDEGLLTTTPVLKTAAEWGTVYVADHETVPVKSYTIQAVNGLFVSETVAATTWHFGDTNNDLIIDLDDILCVLAAFSGNYSTNCTLYSADQIGGFFNPDRIVNLDDILAVLNAFTGQAYPGPYPCP